MRWSELPPVVSTRNRWPSHSLARQSDLDLMLRKCAESPRPSTELADDLLCVGMPRVYDLARHLCSFGMLRRLHNRNPGDRSVIYETTELGRSWLARSSDRVELAAEAV